MRPLFVGSWPRAGRPQAVGSARTCPAGHGAPDGSAVLAVVDDDGRDLQFAFRPAGARFAPLESVSLPPDAEVLDLGPIAFGGQVAALATGVIGDASLDRRPSVLVRSVDGTLRVLRLPPGRRSPSERSDGLRPVAALDRAGRGLVVYGVDGEVLAARFDGTGVIGPAQTLGADRVDDSAYASIAVADDGAAAATWVSRDRTTVVSGSTERGFDLSGRVSAPLGWSAAVTPDGGAAATGLRFAASGNRVLIATRTPGKPFTRARSYRVDGLEEAAPVAVDRRRFLVVLGALYFSRLGRMQAVTGRLGEPPAAALEVPSASAVTEAAVPVLPPRAPATILTLNARRTLCPDCRSSHERREIGVYSLSPRPRRSPSDVKVTADARQSLGEDRTIRVEVFCPRACAIRIVGHPLDSFDPDSGFDDSRTLHRGRTNMRLVFAKPPDRTFRALLDIAVDDAVGELRTQRTIGIRP